MHRVLKRWVFQQRVSRVFHYDRGVKLTAADLALDFTRRQPRAFVSHAHADHMARHELALCTPETSRLYQHRLGKRPTCELPYRQPLEWGGLRLTTYPAGHCLGSAMLLAEDGERSLLFTGDFKLGPSATARPAELPPADILIMECTFGRPEYRLPPREQVIDQLVSLVQSILQHEQVPVVLAYALGKAQEVTKLLTDAGIRVLQHRQVYEVSRVYVQCGVDLGDFDLFREPRPQCAVVVPPNGRLSGIRGGVRIAVTGWAMDAGTKYRLRADHALPLSDHADFDQLLETARCVNPKKIYCTHGPNTFVEHLCDAGFDAQPLVKPKQRQLFY